MAKTPSPGAQGSDPDAPPAFPDIALFRDEVARTVPEVRVATRTLTGHPIVERLLKVEGKKSANADDWHQRRYGTRFGTAIQQRRLRVLAALLGALNRSGCKVAGSTHAGEVFRVTAREMHFVLVLGVEAPMGAAYSPYVRWHGRATTKPILRLKFGDHELEHDDRRAKPLREWADDGSPLEAKLTEAVRAIIILAEEKRRAWVVQRHAWAVEDRRRQEKARQEAEAKAEADRIAREKAAAAVRVKGLLDDSDALVRADRIRAYVGEVRRRAAACADLAAPQDVEAWAAWALAEADRIDPLAGGRFIEAMRALGAT